jgi:hypothetical protein
VIVGREQNDRQKARRALRAAVNAPTGGEKRDIAKGTERASNHTGKMMEAEKESRGSRQ